METMYEKLSPYSEDFRFIGHSLSYIQHFSGMIMVYDIIKTGNTQGKNVGPILSNIVICLLNLKFNFLVKNTTRAKISAFGIIMNLFYLFMFYSFTIDGSTFTVWNEISLAGIFLFTCLLWVEHEDENKIEYHLGMLLSGIFIFLAGSPLLDMGEIIKTKTVKGIRFHSVCMGLTTSTVWVLYGLSTNDRFIVAENICLLLLNVIQFTLFLVFHPSRQSSSRNRPERNEETDEAET